MSIPRSTSVAPSRVLPIVSVAVKIAAVVLLVVAVGQPDLGGIKSKGMGARAVFYPLGLIALPILVLVLRRLRPGSRLQLSWAADLACSTPILVDLVGNRLNLFDTISWWDDAMHVLMHGLLTAGILLQLGRRLSPAMTMMAAVAFAGASGLAWELAEYAAFMRHGVELSGAYLDTLGDLTGGMLGSVAAAGLVLLQRHRSGSLRREPAVEAGVAPLPRQLDRPALEAA